MRCLANLFIAALFISLGACKQQNSDYFDPGQPGLAGLGAEPGQPVYFGLIDLRAPTGDEVTLISLSIPELPGTVEIIPFVLDRSLTKGGGIGAAREGEDTGIPGFKRLLTPLEHYVITPGNEPVEVLVRVTSSNNGTIRFERFNLTFAVAGGTPQTEEFPQGGMVCYRPSLVSCPEDVR
jgi:hypothetical protein